MTPNDIIDGVDQLLSLPDVVIRINELIESDTSSIEEIAEVIGHDPALSAQLLKLVNSAFYGFPAQIDSINRATNLIGTDEIRSLILASSAASVFGNISTELIDMDSFWHRSVYCGLIAKKLYRLTHKGNGEAQFLMGLLHDIGRLVLLTTMSKDYAQQLQQAKDHTPLHELERRWLGFDAADLGAALLEHWHLPARLWVPVKYQHNPEQTDRLAPECQLLSLSLKITNCVEPEVKNSNLGEQLNELDQLQLGDTQLTETEIETIAMEANIESLEVLSIINPGATAIF
ncbi:HDOD domain-containing protein [Motiliproteus sp.]|uniref:HDOD domain-containing protein n=1 Tax=Motiliproteus sp. TaxID=1898955 RepID=UPI003BACED96